MNIYTVDSDDKAKNLTENFKLKNLSSTYTVDTFFMTPNSSKVQLHKTITNQNDMI